jgi:hypothetical protein
MRAIRLIDDFLNAIILGAFFLLLFYSLCSLNLLPTLDGFQLFKYQLSGMIYIGGVCYLVPLMIQSAKILYRDIRFSKPDMRPYYLFNLLAIMSLVATHFLGILLPVFTSFSSVFIVIYVIMKYFEIEFGDHKVLGVLGFGALLLCICLYVKDHPQYFVFVE